MKKIILLIFSVVMGISMMSAQVDDSNHLRLHAQVNEGFYKAFEYPEIKTDVTETKVNQVVDWLLNYPSEDSLRYEGRIVLRFSVYRIGRISHVSVVKGLCPEIDKAARRALLSLRNDLKFSKEYRNKVYIQSFYISKDGSIKTELSADEEIYALPDTPSKPQGGEAALMQFLADELQYPREAMTARMQGRVLVQFVVDKQGDVAFGYLNASDETGALDFEAARLVGNIPTMTPAYHEGKPVMSAWLVPVVFQLLRD